MKAIIIGCPGSGKSYLSKKLKEATNTPLYHLDNLFWNPDGTHIEREELIKKQEEIFNQDNWIIDGNYSATMEKRLEECDVIYYLDLPVEVCLESALSRRGKKRDDLPWVEPIEIDEEFKNFIIDFPLNRKPLINDLLKKYPNKELHIFKTRDEVNKFIETLK